jgi:hypothetical protein
LIGASTGPNFAVEQSAKANVAAAVGDGVGVGTLAVGLVVGTAGSGALALFTPNAIATIAITTTAADPISSGRRVCGPLGSLID